MSGYGDNVSMRVGLLVQDHVADNQCSKAHTAAVVVVVAVAVVTPMV